MSKRRSKKNSKRFIKELVGLIVAIIIVIATYISTDEENTKISDSNNSNSSMENTVVADANVIQEAKSQVGEEKKFDLSTIPEYTENPYVEINGNIPYFSDEEKQSKEVFENYSEWDILGRSGVAFANICKEIMPAEGEERGEIGSVKNLSGWVQKRYDDLISDKYLYNRCHLIGWQLAGENANKNNLITGTRYLNVEGMLPFENMVADYIEDNEKNHVLYRATPVFQDKNMLASGVELEAWSVEDDGNGVCFNVYCYNVQPKIEIDYATGESHEK